MTSNDDTLIDRLYEISIFRLNGFLRKLERMQLSDRRVGWIGNRRGRWIKWTFFVRAPRHAHDQLGSPSRVPA